ncbi:Mitochondrial fission protein [Pleurotus pulmonarius]|nr:Mitochondrial fission protein [Pleurotus pulmonarius]KAF4607097.1 Mitochondrial fission protein [Pleurotus pulmonarius]
MDFATLGRAPLRLGIGTRRITSRDLQIVEATDELLETEVPEPDGLATSVSLLRGFKATIPSAEQGRSRRRQMRNVDTPKLGLRKMGMSARGLLREGDEDDGDHGDHEGQSVASEEDIVVVGKAGKGKRRKRGRESLSTAKTLGRDELSRQKKEIMKDKENIHVKRSLINNEIDEITRKIQALDSIRVKLEQDLLKLQEEDLELDDELEGVGERLEFEESSHKPQKASAQPLQLPQSSRRRKGPAFLPSEHDELPPGVAFMTLESHTTPITSLDFSEPYGTLVSASQDDPQPRVWDLFSGTEIGRLRGHVGTVKCLQVEDHVCLTGGEDGCVRLWDLRRVDEDEEGWDGEGEMVSLSDVAEEEEEGDINEFGVIENSSEGESRSSGIRNGKVGSTPKNNDPCVRVLEGHSKAVTSLYFEDNCLVTGASDKTLRQWDLQTGQCVMTMDILWAISHPPPTFPGSSNPLFSGAAAAAGTFAVPTPPYADGSWDMYQDFVGGVQFWGYGLVSGSGDGAVRMWDMRTGQSHRTLVGHTGPVTCLQFDELHIASGSLDKTLKIWDLRTGGIFETLKYDHAVTALQFDSRKVVAATGENGVKIYNRTSLSLSLYLTLSVTVAPPDDQPYTLPTITHTGEGADEVPLDAYKNLTTRVALYVLRCHNIRSFPSGLKIHCNNEIPFGRGLGSSGAAVIAGVLLGSELGQLNLSTERLLDFALMVERHPDNVTAALVGGFVGSYLKELDREATEAASVPLSEVLPEYPPDAGEEWGLHPPQPPLGIGHYIRFGWAEEIKAVAIIPQFELSTAKARQVLPEQYSRKDLVFNLQRLAVLTTALGQSPPDPGLIYEAMKDRVHQPYRKALIPGLPEVTSSITPSTHPGLLGICLSGAGPTILALATSGFESIAEDARAIFKEKSVEIEWKLLEVVGGSSVSQS